MATFPQIPPEETPKLSYRATRKFEMRETDFSPEVDEAIKNWVYRQVETRRKQLEVRHKQKVPEMRRIAEGRPLEEDKSWPFPNCANLVHQLVGETADELSARVLQLLWATSPVAIFRYFSKSPTQDEQQHNSEKTRVLEQFIDYAAYEPNELNLWEIENLWFSDSAKIGTAWVCVAPEKRVEAVFIGYQDKKTEFEDATLYEGPKVINLRDDDMLYDPDANTPEESEFISRKITLKKRDLQERSFKKLYKEEEVLKIIGKPDRYGPGETKKRENQKKGIASPEERILAEWDVEECYFYWYHNGKKFRLILWFHYETKTVLNQVYNFIPDNQLPIVRTRLAIDNHGMHGTGFSTMLKDNQIEVSTAKNQRTDAITWGILGINRLSPQNKNIDKNFTLFPGACAPFGKDEFEHFDVGAPAMTGLSLQNEQAMIQQARERAGVGPAVAGAGTGSVNKKGQYGSMGTLAVMQDSNSRSSHRTSDFRHSHVKLIGLVTDMYGAMGLGRKGSLFGLDDQILEEALSDYLERKVRIPIRAATASANIEVSKQNGLLLMQALRQHHMAIANMMQAVANAGVPEEAKEWFRKVIKAQDALMKRILRDFQYSDVPEEYVPAVEDNAKNKQADPRIAALAQTIRQPGAGPIPVPNERMGSPAAGPEGQGGGTEPQNHP